MSLDISTLAIQVTSTGITEAAKALNDLVTSANKAEKAFPGLKTAAEALNASNKSSADAVTALLTKLQKQADLLGANQASINAYNAVLKGANQTQVESARSLGAQVDAYNIASKAAKDHTEEIKKLSKAHGEMRVFTAGSTREFLVMFHELSQDQIKRFAGSIIVLGERINFIPFLLRAVASAAEAMSVSLTTAWGAIGLVIAALALAATAVYKFIQNGAELRNYNRELILTGNYAGTTGDALYEMAVKVGKASGSISDAKEAVSELTKSGKFSAEQIEKITAAAVGLQVYGGVAIKETVQDFIKLSGEPLTGTERSFQRVTKAVLQLNESKHFLSAEVLKEISEAERAGDVHKAEAIAQEALIASDAKRIEALKGNMTGFQTMTHNVGVWFSDMWEKVTGAEAATATIARLKAYLAKPISAGFENSTFILAERKRASDQLDELEKIEGAKHKAALKQREDDSKNSEALQGQIVIEAAQKLVKAEESVGERVERLRKAFADQRLAGIVISQDAEDKLIEKFKVKISEKAAKEPSIGLAGLDEELKALDLKLAQEENIYDSELKLLERNRKNKQTSDLVYYSEKEDLLKKELQVVEDTYAKEILAATNFHSKNNRLVIDAAIKKEELQKKLDTAQTRINEKIDANHSDEIKAANASQVAAEKAYTTTVNNLEKEIKTLEDKNNAYRALPESIRQAGITQKQYADLVTQSAIDRLEADKLEDTLGDKEIARLNNQIRLLKEKRTLQQTNESDTAFNDLMLKQTAAAEDAWKAAAKHIEDSVYNAFANGLGTGIKKLITDIKSWFARLVLQPIISPIAQAGASLINPTAASAVNGASMLSTAAMSAGVTNSVANLISGAGSFTGISSASEFAAGMSAGGTEGATAVMAEWGTVTSQATAAGASFGSALAAAVPWIAAAAVAYEVWTNFFEDGPEQNTHLKFTSNNAPGNISINERGNEGKSGQSYIDASGTSAFGTFGVSSSLWMSSSQKVVQDFITNVSKTDDVLAQFLTGAEKASVIANISGKSSTAYTGAEGSDPNANGQLDKVFADRIHNIMEGVETGLSSLTDGFKGTSQELANETSAILQYRMALKDGGEAMFGMKVTLQEVAALRLPTENVSAALNRVTGVFNATNGVLNILGKTSEEAFGKVGLASFDLRNNLVIAAGGVDKLVSSTSYFTQNILTDSEKLKPVTDALKSSLVNLGLSADTTFQQYHDLVLAQKLSTVEGQKMYLALLDLAPAFKAIQDAAGGAADAVDHSAEIIKKQRELDIALLTALGKTEEATAATRYDELAALRALAPQLAVTQQAIYDAVDAQTALTAANKAAEDAATAAANALQAMKDSIAANLEALKKSASNAFDILSKAIQHAKDTSKAEFDTQDTIIKAQKSSAEELLKSSKATIELNQKNASTAYDAFKTATSATLDTAKLANTAIADLSSSLVSVLDTLKETAGYSMTYATGQQIIADALKIARSSGVLPSAESIKDALKAVSNIDASSYRTLEDFTKDARITANNVIGLNEITDKAKTVSDLQLETLNKSLDLAKTDYDTQTQYFKDQGDLAQKSYDDTIARLDENLAAAQAKLDADNKYYDNILSNAKDQLDVMNGTYVAIMSVGQALSQFTTSVNAAISYSASSSVAIASATSAPTSNVNSSTVPASVSGPLTLWQQIENGFWTADNKVINGSHANGLERVPHDNYVANLHVGERVQTAKAARDADKTAEEIRRMKEEMRAQQLTIIQNTKNAQKILDRWDGNGMPPTRSNV